MDSSTFRKIGLEMEDRPISTTTSRIFRLRRSSSTPIFKLNDDILPPTELPVEPSFHARHHSHRSSGSSEIMAHIYEDHAFAETPHTPDLGYAFFVRGSRPWSLHSNSSSLNSWTVADNNAMSGHVHSRSLSGGSIAQTPVRNALAITYPSHDDPPDIRNPSLGPIGGERASYANTNSSSHLAPPTLYPQKSKSLSQIDFDADREDSSVRLLQENLRSSPPLSLQDAHGQKASIRKKRKDNIAFLEYRTTIRAAKKGMTLPLPPLENRTFTFPRIRNPEQSVDYSDF